MLSKKFAHLIELGICYLSMLSIRSKKIYVFGAWKGFTFSDNPKYLFLQALKDKSVMPVWITRNKLLRVKLKEQGIRRVYYYKSIPGIYYQLRASVYFTCMSKQDVFILLLGNATRINLWHGVGLKKILYDDRITNKSVNATPQSTLKKLWKRIHNYPRRKEYVLTTSDTMTKIFMGAFRKNRERFLQLGQPRNDVFFDDKLEFEKFPFKNKAKAIILYMPTHRDEGHKPLCISHILDLDLLHEFCLEHNFLFLIKKHYYHKNENENLEDYNSIVDITAEQYDAQLLLKYADVLITDYSSCYVDFLLLDRPVVFYNYDYDEYLLNDRDLYFDYDATTPGEKVKNFNELMTALKNIMIHYTDSYKAKRQLVKNIFYAPDNQREVGKKILDYVKSNV